jgi:Tetracyclin repressor-like, C-terminal domain
LCRRILRVAPIAALSPEAVVAWIGPTIQRYVTGPLPRA